MFTTFSSEQILMVYLHSRQNKFEMGPSCLYLTLWNLKIKTASNRNLVNSKVVHLEKTKKFMFATFPCDSILTLYSMLKAAKSI
jgi:hypothetical protein